MGLIRRVLGEDISMGVRETNTQGQLIENDVNQGTYRQAAGRAIATLERDAATGGVPKTSSPPVPVSSKHARKGLR